MSEAGDSTWVMSRQSSEAERSQLLLPAATPTFHPLPARASSPSSHLCWGLTCTHQNLGPGSGPGQVLARQQQSRWLPLPSSFQRETCTPSPLNTDADGSQQKVFKKEFPGCPAVRTCASTAGGIGSIPGQGTKISSHASRRGQKRLSLKRILFEEDISLQEGYWDKGESSRMSHIGRESRL